ncbi:MAG: T9SS type A sorting domain-containing protein, partial [Phocaeicola sp.]
VHASSGAPVSFIFPENDIIQWDGKQVHVLNAGKIEVTATQEGNSNYEAAIPFSFDITVTPISQEITPTEDIVKRIGDEPFLLEHTSSSGLPIIFSVPNNDIINLDDNQVQILKAGTIEVTATTQEDRNYLPATITFKIIVQKKKRIITGETLIVKTYGDNDFRLEAYEVIPPSDNPLQYTKISEDDFIDIDDHNISIKNAGDAKILIEQKEDDKYEAASLTVTIQVLKKPQEIIPPNTITEYIDVSTFKLVPIVSNCTLLTVFRAPPNNGILYIQGTTVYIEQVGSVTVEIYQEGNRNHAPCSAEFIINIIEYPPIIIKDPQSHAGFEGDERYCFEVEAKGTNLVYQWYFNGQLITGANNTKYCIDNLQKSNAGEYFVIVSNSAGEVSSTMATLSIYGIEDLEGMVTLYPNPNNGMGSVEVVNLISLEEITIRSDIGVVVYQGSASGTIALFDISRAPAAFYFVQVKTNKGTVVRRMMKMK